MGTACLLASGHLDKVRKKRPLSSIEKQFAKEWEDIVKSKGLKDRTIRDLRWQMRTAHSAYLSGSASDFQRQFVEEVDPLLGDLIEQLGADQIYILPLAFIRRQ
jgi:hypothetical protein